MYDFGGGTFDLTILTMESIGATTMYTVVTTDGDPSLGGHDIDTALVEHFTDAIEKECGISGLRAEKKIMNKLRDACETLKKNLTLSEKQAFSFFGGKGVFLEDREVTREDFNHICAPIFERTMDCVKRACERALKNGGIDECMS